MIAANGGSSLMVLGSAGNDTVAASGLTAGHAVVFVAGAGSDSFTGGAGNDFVSVAAGDLSGSDSFTGGAGTDILLITGSGAVSAASLAGVSGFEQVRLNGGVSLALSDAVIAANGGSSLAVLGSAGNDTVDASGLTAGHAVVFVAGAGNDSFAGGAGNDTFQGGDGDDTLDGGVGADALNGGAGLDNFVFSKGYATDVVSGFEDNVDTILLNDDLWGGGLTVAQVLATYATQVSGSIVDLDFGGGDMLRISQAGITIAALQDDIAII